MASSIRGTVGRIGFLWPADGLNDDEFWNYLPDGVALLTARYAVTGSLEAEGLEADAAPAPIVAAARLVALARIDVAALGDCAGSFILGHEHEQAMIRAVAGELGKPATAMSGAIVAALRVLGVRRVALAAPYRPEVAARLIDYLDGRDIEVTSHRALGHRTESTIAGFAPEHWHGAAKAIAEPPAEAVVLGGGGVRAAAGVDAMEADLGIPVVAGPGALIWHACRLIGVDATRSGLGRLFSEHGAAHVEP